MIDVSIDHNKSTMLILVCSVLISLFIYGGGLITKCKVAPHAADVYGNCLLIFGTNVTPIQTWNAKELEVSNEVMKQILACYSVKLNLTNEEFILQDDFLTIINNSYSADDQVRKQFMNAVTICQRTYDNHTKDGTWAVMSCINYKKIEICDN